MNGFNKARLLLTMELKSLRQSWYWCLGMAALYPLSVIFFLKFNGQASNGGVQAIAGSIVFALVLNTTLGLGQEISVLRETSSMDFYATLPITKVQFILAILARSILLAVPAVLVVLFLGSLILHAQIQFSLWLFPILLLSCLALAGWGALIGFYSPSARFANFFTQALYMLVAFVSPVMLPSESLPKALKIASYALPTTYAVDALRQVFSSQFGPSFFFNLIILTVFSWFALYVMTFRLEWRARE